MDTGILFEKWRKAGKKRPHWGLAWFLGLQFCRRFYASHGIVPHVTSHEGLGYYGIQLDDVSCRVNTRPNFTYGRLTGEGDVENWRIGRPGDHGLKATQLCHEGMFTDQLVAEAVRFMDLPPYPVHSHAHCRHKRWGSSYELVFEIATILALTREDGIGIWNHPHHTERHIKALDPNADMHEHPGAFMFGSGENPLIVIGDGRVLDGSGLNLWETYMQGASAYALATMIGERIAR